MCAKSKLQKASAKCYDLVRHERPLRVTLLRVNSATKAQHLESCACVTAL